MKRMMLLILVAFATLSSLFGCRTKEVEEAVREEKQEKLSVRYMEVYRGAGLFALSNIKGAEKLYERQQDLPMARLIVDNFIRINGEWRPWAGEWLSWTLEKSVDYKGYEVEWLVTARINKRWGHEEHRLIPIIQSLSAPFAFLSLDTGEIFAVKKTEGLHPSKEPWPPAGLYLGTSNHAFTNQKVRLLTEDGELFESEWVPIGTRQTVIGPKPLHKRILFKTTGKNALLFVDYKFSGQKRKHTAVFQFGDHDYGKHNHSIGLSAWRSGEFSVYMYGDDLEEWVHGLTYWLRSKDNIHSKFDLK